MSNFDSPNPPPVGQSQLNDEIADVYRDLVDSCREAVLWSMDPSTGHSRFVSPRTLEMTGFSAEQWMRQPHFFRSRVPPEDLALVEAEMARALDGAEVSFEHRFLRADRRVLWLQTVLRRGRNGAGWLVRGLSVDVTRLKETERKALASEGMFRSVSDSMPQMVFVADADGLVTHFNRRWFDYTGYAADDLTEEAWAKAVHPDDLPGIFKTWKTARATGEPWVHEYRIRRADGEYRWHLGRSVPDRDGNGRLQRWIGAVNDIEDQKRTEKDLKGSKESLETRVLERTKELTQAYVFLDSVIENFPNMIFVKDAETLRFLRFNRAGEELLGIPRERLIGKSDLDIFPKEQAEAFQAKDRAVLAEDAIADIPEESISTVGSGVRVLHTKKIPIFDESGVARYIVGISEDITEQKRLEEERVQFIQAQILKREAEKAAERLNFLSEASAMLGSSLDFETTLVNMTKLAVPAIADWCSVHVVQTDRSLKRVALATRESQKTKWAWDLYSDYPLNMNAPIGIANVARTGRAEMADVTSAVLDRVARDPEHRRVLEGTGALSYICAPIMARSEVLGVLSLATTTESLRRYGETELRLAEDLCVRAGFAIENARLYREAQGLNRVKDEFLATLSHELRTPLNVILGHAEILRGDGPSLPDNELRGSIDAIFRNAKSQASLIGDLLDVSSIITGKVSYKPTESNPAEIVANILESLRPTADAKGVRLIGDLAEAPAEVFADPTRLHQIVWNLASNAIKFTPRGGQVMARLAEVGDEWQIIVSDTGRGIDRDFLPYVFDRFRQEDASSTRKYGGLGLGLSIVRHLVELHGGHVEAQSAGRERGSIFRVTLPLAGMRPEEVADEKPHAVDAAPGDAPRGEVGLDGVSVLLVEDSTDSRALIKRMLTRAGANLVEAASAAEARDVLKTFHPDVIVSDIGMPEENGIEFIRGLRASACSDSRETPAIALTAYVRPEEIQSALEAGFQAHVAKPVSTASLTQAIRRFMN